MTTDAEEKQIALRESRNDRPSQVGRLWSSNRERIGVIGEREVADFFGVKIDFLIDNPAGDDGVDFMLPLRVAYPVDVKAARSAPYLLVDINRVRKNTIYILVEVDVEADTGKIKGWEWGKNVMEARTENWCNNGVWVHVIPASELRPINELLERQVQP